MLTNHGEFVEWGGSNNKQYNIMKYIIGSVSHGTMRAEDLIPAFMGALQTLSPERHAELEKEMNEELLTDDDKDYFLNETLFDAMNEFAPPYFYFGSHPGDGSDYGFWLSEGAFEEFDGLKVSDTSEVPADYTGEVLCVNDHGNATLYGADNGKLTEIWSVV